MYYFCLLLIQTQENKRFGAFITAFPCYNPRVIFKGTHESFVFSIEDDESVDIFQTIEPNNDYYLSCDYKSFSVGAGGDGPAIRLDNELHKGWTNACETFGSPILIPGGIKH